uniref:Uncharacterized protein n=1 Tax=Tanacetum cinerariifolium TaxID=118510 RepID=A0A699JZU4_TANCI|nr:hypothetical protein [Tanacetum cinerariifolium]
MVVYLEKTKGNAQFHRIVEFVSRIHPFRSYFSKNEKFGSMYPNKGKKAKTGLNIEEGNSNKLNDLVGEGANYAVNKGRSTDKRKVINDEAEGVSAVGETLSTATLVVSTVN